MLQNEQLELFNFETKKGGGSTRTPTYAIKEKGTSSLLSTL